MQKTASYKKSKNLTSPAFTIVELLIVIVVIAILAAIVIVSYNGITKQAKESGLKSDLKNGLTQLQIMRAEDGAYPSDASSLQKSTNTTFAYSSSGDSFCLSATTSDLAGTSFYVTEGGAIKEGECPGGSGSWFVITLAGGSAAGFVNGTGTAARFNFTRPSNGDTEWGIDSDSQGNVYVADHGNNLIRKITPSGAVSTLAGMTGDNGEIVTDHGATSAFDYPLEVAVVGDNETEILVVGTGGCIRVVWIGDAAYPTDIINGNSLEAHDGHMECGWGTDTTTVPAWGAHYRMPSGIVADSAHNLYINESYTGVVRKMTFVTNDWWDQVFLLSSAGSFGAASKFGIDPQDRIYGSSGNRIVRFTSSGVRSDFAGSSSAGNVDGTGSNARFSDPLGVDGDANGNIYVADCSNASVRMITPSGEVSTIAGSGTEGHVDGDATQAQFYCPADVAVSADGSTVYVLDLVWGGETVGGYIRKVSH